MKQKVGIITSYLDFDKNYGGVLQAYALSKQISLLGYEAYIMPYIYEHIPTDKKADITAWKIFRTVRNSLVDSKQQKAQKQMQKMMMAFVSEKLPMYQSSRMRTADLKGAANSFYAFVCGSDQVWSTRLQGDHCDPGMFLSFVPNGVKKIAYAPSIGSTVEMSPETAEEFNKALSTYDAISVREYSGQKLIKNITQQSVPVVLDPTLLLNFDEWNAFEEIPNNLPAKYILVYRFGNLQSTYDEITEIKNHLNLPVIELPSSAVSLYDGLEKRYDINPSQFIGLIRNASLVCTDSFHASVFSILTKTPLAVFYRQDPNSKATMNARIDDLLSMTELSKCLIKPNEHIDYNSVLNCDFQNAHDQINLRKEDSLNYLKQSLSGAKG